MLRAACALFLICSSSCSSSAHMSNLLESATAVFTTVVKEEVHELSRCVLWQSTRGTLSSFPLRMILTTWAIASPTRRAGVHSTRQPRNLHPRHCRLTSDSKTDERFTAPTSNLASGYCTVLYSDLQRIVPRLCSTYSSYATRVCQKGLLQTTQLNRQPCTGVATSPHRTCSSTE